MRATLVLIGQTNPAVWAVVVAQLAEGSLPTPEVYGSNPDIGEILNRTFMYCQLYCIEKKNKIKRPGMANLTYFQPLTSMSLS